jgi:type III secretory pathway component EscV
MFEEILSFFRQIDWTGYEVSVFEVLLVIFALLKKFNLLSLLILAIVLGKGFIVVQSNTNFSGEFVETVPFLFYTVCALIFFIYGMAKMFAHEG